MKMLRLILLFTALPTAALAWAPYEQQSFVQQMESQQVQVDAAQVETYDPAMVPLALVDGYEYEAESPASDTNMPLDAD